MSIVDLERLEIMNRSRFLWRSVHSRSKRHRRLRLMHQVIVFLVLLVLCNSVEWSNPPIFFKKVHTQVALALAVHSSKTDSLRLSPTHIAPLPAPLYSGNPLL